MLYKFNIIYFKNWQSRNMLWEIDEEFSILLAFSNIIIENNNLKIINNYFYL